MSKDFKITEEEINQVILRSPYSLADSPASLGQGASQIKCYFYAFIFELARKINTHLGQIMDAFSSQELVNSSLKEMDRELGSSIATGINSHNLSGQAHSDIREKASSDLINHKNSTTDHIDIRQKIEELQRQCSLASALASGKMQVHAFDDVVEMLEYLSGDEKKHIGDIFLISDPTMPDFTLFEIGADLKEGDIELSYEDIASGTVTLEANKSYYFGGVRLISSEGNLETSYLAKQEALDSLEALFIESTSKINSAIEEIRVLLNGKDNIMPTYENSDTCVEISSGNEYNLGLRTAIELDFVPSEVFEAIFNFRTDNIAPSFDAPVELYFVGDDTLDGSLYPITNRIYEVNIKRVCGALIARVGAVDYEVIE